MATAVTLVSRLQHDGSIVVPNEAYQALGICPGDEITVEIQVVDGSQGITEPSQAELHRRAEMLFDDADHLVREPGIDLSDGLEAAWANGMVDKARRMGLNVDAD